MAEWLRRWTANPLCSARVGSNPLQYSHQSWLEIRMSRANRSKKFCLALCHSSSRPQLVQRQQVVVAGVSFQTESVED